jgi:hypothetical protein
MVNQVAMGIGSSIRVHLDRLFALFIFFGRVDGLLDIAQNHVAVTVVGLKINTISFVLLYNSFDIHGACP